jgi:hypothetical protein
VGQIHQQGAGDCVDFAWFSHGNAGPWCGLPRGLCNAMNINWPLIVAGCLIYVVMTF